MKSIQITSTKYPADQNPALVYLSGLAKGSQRTQTTALESIAREFSDGKIGMREFPWHMLRYQHTRAFRARMADIPGVKPATINRYLSALRGTLKEAKRLGLMSGEDYVNAVDIENIKFTSIPKGNALTIEDIKALLQICSIKNNEVGIRDTAIISLMYVTGMRRAEVSNLNVGDFEVSEGKISIINGKRNKSRTSYVGENAKRHLINWLSVRGVKPGAMFFSVNNHGDLTDERFGDQGIYDMLKRRIKQAGINDFSPHDLRRTAITEMLDRGVDIAKVADVVGHESLDTTRRYDRRGEKAKRAITEIYDTPI